VKNFLRRVPLRVKLVAAVLGLVALALVVISVASAFALRNYLLQDVDQDLQHVTRTVNYAALSGQETALPTDYLIELTSQDLGSAEPTWHDVLRPQGVSSSQYPALPAATAPAPAPGTATPVTVAAQSGRDRWRLLVSSLPNGQRLAVARSLSDVDHAVSRLLWTYLLVGFGVLAALGALGVTIVRRSLRPLTEIEQTAAAIGAGDLTRRVSDFEGSEQPKTEVGRLSRALNAMLAQIEAAFTARAASETAALAAESAARDAAAAAHASETRSRRSEERMRQFVADASHELRTPLTTIRGFAELYRQGAARGEEETGRLLRRIEDEAARMGLLVEDLLLLARLDRERPLELGPVELPVIAADTVQAARAVDPDRRVSLEIAADAGPLVVLGDDARLRQVVGNLVTNALTHTPDGTPVAVRLYRTGDESAGQAVLEVADRGPGLNSEQVDKAFERFYRGDAARTRSASGPAGTGLGLAIVAALVAAHSGSVEVESKLGEGATFRVRLPLAHQP
jgi:two-component system OmpR family sensor kinase